MFEMRHFLKHWVSTACDHISPGKTTHNVITQLFYFVSTTVFSSYAMIPYRYNQKAFIVFIWEKAAL